MNLIQNIILTNLFIVLIYLVYKGGLSKSHFFQANRIIIMTGSSFALILPWISPVMNFLKPAAKIQWLPATPVAMEPAVQFDPATLTEPASAISTAELVLWVYLVIAATITLRYLFRWIKLLQSTRNKPVHRVDRLRVIEINSGWSVFSFFRTVYYPKPFDPSLPETKLILDHELVHARQLHSLDNLFFGSLRLAFYFNPCIHLLHKELMITHEYLADRLTSGSDQAGYSRILISHQFKVPHFVLMHSFNKQSFLKRRLNMLSKNTQNRLAGWKYLLVLPLFGGMILGSSWSVTAQDQAKKSKEEIAKMAVEKELSKAGFSRADIEEIKFRIDGVSSQREAKDLRTTEEFRKEQVFLVVEEMPTFQGGKLEDFSAWVQKNMKYPEEAKAKKISGTEYVEFVVDTLGLVANVKIIRSVDPILDKEVLRVIKSAPAWKPGKQRGHLVNVAFSMPVKFVLDGTGDSKVAFKETNPVEKADEDQQVFSICEEMPEFNGGTLEKFTAWAQANVKYPAKAMEESISGTVEVSFIVNKEGKVVNVEIKKSADPVLDEAVLNVVRSSPTWKPGKQRGHLVKVSQTIPIKFILQ